MFGRRTPEQLAVRDHVKRQRGRDPIAGAKAERLKGEVDKRAKGRA